VREPSLFGYNARMLACAPPADDPAASIPTDLDLDLYDYDLPPERIAQQPAERREESRLMVLPAEGVPEHRGVRDLPELLAPGTLLVVNDTLVVPARLAGRKESGGALELLRVPDPDLDGREEARFLVNGARLKRPGSRVRVRETFAELVRREQDGSVVLRLVSGPDFEELIERAGAVPLPPYISRPEGPTDEDGDRYQTVYARRPGAVAAPTAGLHFSRELLSLVAARGVEIAALTLHVGPGTFLPVRCRDVRGHSVLAEPVTVPETTARAVGAAKAAGRPVVAVGTTVTRTLEGAARRSGSTEAPAHGSWAEDLTILPGYRFEVVDGLLTNFHLPRSSLLLLVSALAGRRRLLDAYAEAVASGYRFYSYGDAMLIPPRAR